MKSKLHRAHLIVWVIFWIALGLFSLVQTSALNVDSIAVGPHQTFEWNGGRTAILGDGQTVLLKNSYAFTIFDEKDNFIVAGEPEAIKPGETSLTFHAELQTVKGKKYHTDSYLVYVYANEPIVLNFEFYKYGFAWLTTLSAIVLIITYIFWFSDLPNR